MSGVAPLDQPLRIHSDREGRYIRIDVVDRGRGIAKDDEARVFVPFHSTKNNGMGLGLSISRSIIEAFGGSLTFQTNLDGGVTFSAKLPLAVEVQK